MTEILPTDQPAWQTLTRHANDLNQLVAAYRAQPPTTADDGAKQLREIRGYHQALCDGHAALILGYAEGYQGEPPTPNEVQALAARLNELAVYWTRTAAEVQHFLMLERQRHTAWLQ